jgi:general secretion pathway protein D
MRPLYRIGVVLLVALLSTLPAATADQAKALYDKGLDAEYRQNYEAAYEAYKQAFDLKPRDVKYRAAFERTRFQAATARVHRGQVLREDGKLAEALGEFQKALEIDPSSFIAQQEVRRTKELIEQSNNPSQKPRQQNISDQLMQAAPPVELAPISDQPITLRMTEDSKVIYETIGRLAGLNVLFDPDYTSRRIKIELNNVSLNEALDIVQLQSKTFWRPVTPNTIYVATDSKNKRQEIEPQVLKTFYLSNVSSGTDLQDLTNTLRSVLELQRIQQIVSQGAIVVRGTAAQVALAEKLINDIDKAKPEVIVDVAVMQVRRDKLRNLGISPPFTATQNPTITLQNKNATTTTNGTTSTTSTTTTPLTLNDLANLDARNFAVSIPSVSLAFFLSDATTKVIQNPQVRALDGQKASLKIGDRVPVATGSFSGAGGVSGLGVSPLVNTQFNYIDVGVNIDMTPKVHANRDVSLKVMLEISAVTGQSQIGGTNGITQPIIGQRRIDHDVRLKEGEVNLIGGIFEDSNSKSMSGMPWFSQVPILKYLFGQESAQHTENEIVLALIPHVVRAQDLNELNNRTLDIGTVNAIGLRRVAATTTTNGAPQQPHAGEKQAAPPAAAPNQTVATNVPPSETKQLGPMGAGAIVSFDPPTINQPVGSTFAVNIAVSGGQNVFSVPAQVTYDPKLLQLANVSNGNALSKDGQVVALVHRDDQQAGSLQLTATRPPGAPGVPVDGVVFTLTFVAKAPGQGTLSVNRAVLRDPSMNSMPASGSQAVITIR